MNETSKPNYLYLNRDGQWPGFSLQGLKRGAEGILELLPVPLLAGSVPSNIKDAGTTAGPAGIAVSSDGTVYFSDPGGGRVRQLSGCDGNVRPLPCFNGHLGSIGQITTPRGLLVPKRRSVLFVSDSGNHRVLVLDPDSGQILAILGQPSLGATPMPGSNPGRLNTPWGLGGDSEDSVYVLDYGNARVQKWNAVGDLVGTFAENLLASKLLTQPVDVCTSDVNGSIRVFIVDASALQIFVFDSSGSPVTGPDGKPFSIGQGRLKAPLGIASSGDSIYIGDNQARRILQFSTADASFVGEARGYDGPTAALCLDATGDLWVHAGTSDPPLKLSATGAYASAGVLWTEQPISLDHPKVQWQRLQAEIKPLPYNSHLEFLVYTSNDPANGPKPINGDPLADAKWRYLAQVPSLDLNDIYIGGQPATYLWLAARFISDGIGTPVMSQIRVQFDSYSYLNYLPAIYRNDAACGDFLLRLLSLFESVNQDVETEIGSLPKLFDPLATPKEFLPWLAEWLDLELDESWSEEKQRQILREIFRLYARRGTPAGLRRMLKLFAGINAVIDEPIMQTAWWALPETEASCCEQCAASTGTTAWVDKQDSILGITTMLAPAQPQGAVVGTTAILDQSHLTTVDEFGAPLFRDVAYQFSVLLYRGEVMCADVLPRVRAFLDQEKPAHTLYQLCIVEPRMRVGYQSRVGVDTVVAGPGRSLALGSGQALGQDTVLAGPLPTRLGQSRLGVSTRVG